MRHAVRPILVLVVTLLALAPGRPAAAQFVGSDPDRQLAPGEPDFTLAALPTTLRMPAGAFAFRLTHRFARPIGLGDAGDFFADFFGLDSAAQVGLELRYGIRPGTQATVHRTNNRTIQFLGQHEILGQDASRPVTIDALVAVEGENNFSESFSTSLGGVLSHRFGERGALYAHPVYVFNATVPAAGATAGDDVLLLGIGGRWRLGGSRAYVVLEAAPRLTGETTGVDHVSVAIERRAGGHVFQFNVSNSFGTTLRQLARGGARRDDWYVGFNLTRKFY
ncbi:MAG: DUF5777 family beta-barrel protein [Vicinamibacterales bacterium]